MPRRNDKYNISTHLLDVGYLASFYSLENIMLLNQNDKIYIDLILHKVKCVPIYLHYH